ncbi:TVP38/TMEM64 family protein [Paenibacillus sp. F6_3S_P_1C]|uniref:TVP38/TMEM64 family membrane protein n=1 Tax=Paenibacillus vandeheii TaxID=3035917 RepID=A0ABT8JAS9_9BACL|nr:TVP38/TMEM64 family protein [Paenibacillus vandeheii]MDN4601319.1 TVP38/TMEM64 family protein [Paenibacillus vandeheii]
MTPASLDIMSYITEENIRFWLEKFRSLGPLPGILLTFTKSFVPPLPTLLIVGVNGAVYGLWAGFLYSWIGMVLGCTVTFLIVREIGKSAFVERWASKPRVQRSMVWIRRNAFSYVFLLSIFPVGPFVIINVAAGIARMRFMSFLLAVSFGKAIMIFCVTYIGSNVAQFMEHPVRWGGVLLFIAVSLWASRKLERHFTRSSSNREEMDDLSHSSGKSISS